MLTPAHKAALDDVVTRVGGSKVVGLLPLAALCGVWAWVATQFLRLHDRVHEPKIRKWRAIYDADFILRALTHEHGGKVTQELFERA